MTRKIYLKPDCVHDNNVEQSNVLCGSYFFDPGSLDGTDTMDDDFFTD